MVYHTSKSNSELESLPHVLLTFDKDWDPTVLDNDTDIDTANWYPKLDQRTKYGKYQFDEIGMYRGRVINELISNDTHNIHNNESIENTISTIVNYKYNNTILVPQVKDFTALQQQFGWIPINVIKKTFEVTTQHVQSLHLYNDRENITNIGSLRLML
jgi:hypothetical protein